MFVEITKHTVRDFSQWVQYFGEHFLVEFAAGYDSEYGDARTATENTAWYQIQKFLNFISQADSAKFLKKWLLNHDWKSKPPLEMSVYWYSVIASYREFLKSRYNENSTRSNAVWGANRFLEIAENRGLVPLGLRLHGWKVEPEIGQGSTFLDVTIDKSIDLEALVGSGLDFVEDAVELDDQEREGIRTLVSNIMIEAKESNQNEEIDLFSSAATVLARRIELVKCTSAEIIVGHINKVAQASIWASDPEIMRKAKDLHELFRTSKEIGAKTAGNEYLRLLSADPLPVLVAYAIKYYDHLWPRERGGGLTDLYYPQFLKKIRNNGLSPHYVRSYLGNDSLVLAAAHAFITIEVAGNPDSISNLQRDALQYEEDAQVYVLSWNKYRSGEEPESEIVSSRTDGGPITKGSLSVEDVFRHVLQITEPMLALAREEDQNALFMGDYKNNTRANIEEGFRRPTKINPATLNSKFREICHLASSGKWSSPLKAIRGSVLLLEGLLTGDATAVGKKGRHKTYDMARKYVSHMPEMLRRTSKIREFLAWFEALLTIDIEDYADKIGIDKEAYDERKKVILENHFGGIQCSDPKAGVQPGTVEGVVCDRVDKCVSCEQRRDIFVLSQSNVISLLQWHAVIERAQKGLSEDEFEPWALWFLYTNMMLERLSSAPQHSTLLRNAQEEVRRRPNPYQQIIPAIDVTKEVV
ncbi:hypothetical protein ACTXK7_19450 [Vreelandella alkaliphila]|uniref:hypothetical protein n=1 Tax=Vreelandella alkaliphila TaxID=272774 RepID=UPI003FD7EC76